MTHLLEKATDWLMGCTHERLTWPQSNAKKGIPPYQVCLTCGKEIQWKGMEQ